LPIEVGLENENRPSMIPEFSPPVNCSTCSKNLNPFLKYVFLHLQLAITKISALEETSSPGNGFLANVCKDWEAETYKANALGIRTVALSLGIILGPDDGITAKDAASVSNETWRSVGERRLVNELDSCPRLGRAHSYSSGKLLLSRPHKCSQSSSGKKQRVHPYSCGNIEAFCFF
jgi:hypothetical protein